MEEIISKIPMDFLQKHQILPLGMGDRLRVGIKDKESLEILEDIRLILQCDIEPVFLSSEEIESGLRSMMGERLDESEEEDSSLILSEDEAQDLMSVSRDAPIVSLVSSLFLKAVSNRASDIHLEPYEGEAVVRMRVDGTLHEILTLSKTRYASVNARIKVMSKLNLAESRLPQDGRIRLKAGDKVIDVRVSTVPTLFGERIVMRLLDMTNKLLSLEEVGLLEGDFKKIDKLINNPYGLLLSTGPTGSGKSTTLYGVLQKVLSPQRNVITIEDPVEYQVAGIGQIQVNPKIGLTFANGLRSILRQDPDVVMVGEIRDGETAEIAIHASLTGHLVLSTLHTNDAPTAVSRLMDMGVEGYLVSSSLLGVVAQRLIRQLCTNCREMYRPEKIEIQRMGLDPDEHASTQFFRAKGCPRCLDTGYYSRTGIFEVMTIDEEMRSLITRSGEAVAIRKMASKKGMKALIEDGTQKVIRGITSVEEIMKATSI
ncbi:MAG: Flp pilus assembly complex ATPase component TadA [Candidatus Eremiobacteraeota bacterium]|nr:Flp pilus assembly complex ATPase component TadA [Candidatus Eremiobacteraeota bacterium]